ncbi:DUF2080 family transposase-associated protein [Methanococcus maripaludis]|uniref:DUF2080 family transposase-associated protein n=1 Tax=Methanococcus maripaludis TaxID=39152 RepID=UPI0015EB6753|nr:DUF2080 family transposase-associated protein [Methanococcus maripaludis]
MVRIEVKKKTWRKPRSALPTFIAKVAEHGNSANIEPKLPKEYIGKTVLITIIEEDEELTKQLLKEVE